MRRSGGDADFEIPVPLVLGLLALPIGAFVSMILHYPSGGLSPAAVAGCYTAADAPPMALDGNRMHFGQPGFAPVGYGFAKERLGGLSVAPQAGIVLTPAGHGYSFALAAMKSAPLFPLVRVVNGHVVRVRRPSDMEAIAVPAGDGRELLFGRAPPARCASALGRR